MSLLPLAPERAPRSLRPLATLALAIAFLAPCALAQDQAPEPKPPREPPTPEIQETFNIKNATAQRDVNDLQTALRNMLPRAKIYTDQTHNSLLLRATAEDMETARKVIAELDQPRKAYRVTYTVTETDGGKPTGSWHFAVLVVEGEKTTLRQGNRVPVVSGMQSGATSEQNEQVQYIDVGLNLDATIDGQRLHSKIERTAMSDEKSGLGAQDPVLNQVALEGVSSLSSSKPTILGSLDIAQSTRHQEIEVQAEPLN